MTTKFKILSTISFICLALVLTFVGVWALTDLDFVVGGNITYTAPEPFDLNKLKWDSVNSYWYVTMGHTDTISEIRWRLVGVNDTRYTSSTKPTSGTGTFILETNLSKYHTFGSYDGDEWVVGNNDYSTSYIREYLTGNSSYALDYNGAVDNTNQGSFLADFGITETDAVYSAIQARDMESLYTDIGWATSSSSIGAGNQWSPPAGTTQYATYNTKPKSTEGSDRLWLMSVKEIYTLVGGGTIGTDKVIQGDWSSYCDNLIWNEEFYWLRSPDPSDSGFALGVDYGGDCCWYDYVSGPRAVRPAFNLVF